MPSNAAFALAQLQLLLANEAIPNVGNTGGLLGSSVAGSLYIALHTASPADGAQSVNEAAYPGYARVAIARAGGSWTFTEGSTSAVSVIPANAANAAQVQFGLCDAPADEIETYFSVGVAASGATEVLVYAALNTQLQVTQNIQPTFAPGQLNATCN